MCIHCEWLFNPSLNGAHLSEPGLLFCCCCRRLQKVFLPRAGCKRPLLPPPLPLLFEPFRIFPEHMTWPCSKLPNLNLPYLAFFFFSANHLIKRPIRTLPLAFQSLPLLYIYFGRGGVSPQMPHQRWQTLALVCQQECFFPGGGGFRGWGRGPKYSLGNYRKVRCHVKPVFTSACFRSGGGARTHTDSISNEAQP